MVFRDITCKLGNMRKPAEFTVYPNNPEDTEITIQSDKRIAKVNLTTKTAILSDGKGGHQGTPKLMAILGATTVAVPDDVIEQLTALAKQGTGKVVSIFG